MQFIPILIMNRFNDYPFVTRNFYMAIYIDGLNRWRLFGCEHYRSVEVIQMLMGLLLYRQQRLANLWSLLLLALIGTDSVQSI